MSNVDWNSDEAVVRAAHPNLLVSGKYSGTTVWSDGTCIGETWSGASDHLAAVWEAARQHPTVQAFELANNPSLRKPDSEGAEEAKEFCFPRDEKPKWLLMFADPERGNALYDNEQDAYAGFDAASANWTCYLFAPASRLPSSPEAKDDPLEGFDEWWSGDDMRGDLPINSMLEAQVKTWCKDLAKSAWLACYARLRGK